MTERDKIPVKCPHCGGLKSHVTDSRGSLTGNYKRRRRKCLNCMQTFTTWETTIDPKQYKVAAFTRNEIIDHLIYILNRERISIDTQSKT